MIFSTIYTVKMSYVAGLTLRKNVPLSVRNLPLRRNQRPYNMICIKIS